MEAWKDELYHHGIKGMKWGKRKKGMSEAEKLGREFETNYRRSDAMNEQYKDVYIRGTRSTKGRDWGRDWNESNRTFSAYEKSREKLGKINEAAKKKVAKDGHGRYLKSGVIWDNGKSSGWKNSDSSTEKHAEDRVNYNGWTGTADAKKKAKKRVHRKVQVADAKYKAKSYVKNLFKKKRK